MATPAGRNGRAYWRSLDELTDTPAFRDMLHREYPALATLSDATVDRRALLRVMGASLALLGAAGCDPPDEEIIPYVKAPEDVVPGVPRYYATAVTHDGYAHGVLGETHMGRPTRLTGNPDHPLSRGASNIFTQASVLDLYDPDRSRAVRRRGIVTDYSRFLDTLARKRAVWKETGGKGLRILSGRVTSPSLLRRLARLRAEFPEMRWHQFEPVSRETVSEGARLAFGERLDTHFRFGGARAVLSLDSDFLSVEEPEQLRYARDFMAARRPRDRDAPPCRLYAVESAPGQTGAVSDHRLLVAAPRVATLARALAAGLGITVSGGDELNEAERRWLTTVSRDLEANRGRAPVVVGYTQPAAVHALVHAINDRLGNFGRTVMFSEPVTRQADGGIGELANDMARGQVETLVILGQNPVYTAPADLDFANLIGNRVSLCIHWGVYYDETAWLSEWHLPAAHELEAWGDARAVDGTVTIQQPLIAPLRGGRPVLELLAALGGEYQATANTLVRRYWQERSGGGDFDRYWRKTLKAGVVDGSAAKDVRPALKLDTAGLQLDGPAPSGQGGTTLQFRPDAAVWDGRFANNGWLQELPRPLTKLVWGNAALVSPALARRLGIESGRQIRIRSADRAVTAPVWILPGHPDESVTLPLGYGRQQGGRVAQGIGFDANRLRTAAAPWFAAGATIEVLDESEQLVTTQQHHAMEDRGLVRRADWATWRNNPHFAQKESDHPSESLYPEPSPAGRVPGKEGWTAYDWGMSIDFDACIGCNACVIACQSENNIPIVGKAEVARGREMHWLRIDRYYKGDPANPETVFQPVACMHCENAPCEYVCPVEATVHSSEGLNEMVYNRCIGTRYCSQNCPYKVRRFNWLDYTHERAEHPALRPLQNPDVTVRSRGVMEKCTYCVQRINRTRILAQREGRTIGGDEVTTACQDACPTRAIVFGDINNRDSEVHALKANPRSYGLLEGLNTRPRTSYLAAVRNPNPDLAEEG